VLALTSGAMQLPDSASLPVGRPSADKGFYNRPGFCVRFDTPHNEVYSLLNHNTTWEKSPKLVHFKLPLVSMPPQILFDFVDMLTKNVRKVGNQWELYYLHYLFSLTIWAFSELL
jgi:hypothetical protein